MIQSIEKISGNKNIELDGEDDPADKSIVIAGGTAGTYAVRTQKGLVVSNKDPTAESVLSYFQGEEKVVKKLVYRQTVQIASIKEKVATVAGGNGFIVMEDSDQLVKGKWLLTPL